LAAAHRTRISSFGSPGSLPNLPPASSPVLGRFSRRILEPVTLPIVRVTAGRYPTSRGHQTAFRVSAAAESCRTRVNPQISPDWYPTGSQRGAALEISPNRIAPMAARWHAPDAHELAGRSARGEPLWRRRVSIEGQRDNARFPEGVNQNVENGEFGMKRLLSVTALALALGLAMPAMAAGGGGGGGGSGGGSGTGGASGSGTGGGAGSTGTSSSTDTSPSSGQTGASSPSGGGSQGATQSDGGSSSNGLSSGQSSTDGSAGATESNPDSGFSDGQSSGQRSTDDDVRSGGHRRDCPVDPKTGIRTKC
jgi:hypothetical protein